ILDSTELFDPGTGTFSLVGTLKLKRSGHAAILLKDGRVLILGGNDGTPGKLITQPEIYDPKTRQSTLSKARMSSRLGYTPVLLPNGNVLLHGGMNVLNKGTSAKLSIEMQPLPDEIYIPTRDQFITVGEIEPLKSFKVSLLPNGKVLFTGGVDGLLPVQTSEI